MKTVAGATAFALLAILLGTGLTGCRRAGIGAPEGGGSVSPSKVVLQRKVELAEAQGRGLVARVETIGMLEAEGTTDIAAGVPGIVDEVLFREGDEVRAGTLLVTIDKAKYEADEQLAKANVERGKAALDLARDLADRAERSGLGTSEEERSKARGGYRVAEAELRSVIAAHARAKSNLERSRVRAPYPGRINKRLVTKGSYLEERTVIATMADLTKIRLVGYVPETAAPAVRELIATQDDRLRAARLGVALGGLGPLTGPLGRGLAAAAVQCDMIPSGFDPEFEIMALPGQRFIARIFYLSTVANPETHMFECKAEVLGWRPDISDPSKPREESSNSASLKLRPALWPGFTAKITFPTRSTPSACVIPEEAIRNTERGTVVFVPEKKMLDGGKTEWIVRARVLELGFRGNGDVEVRQGLHVGDWVVCRGAEALEDGTPVSFKTGPR